MFIVKIGGSVLSQSEEIVKDLANYKDFIVVHGSGPQVDKLTKERLGKEPRWVYSVSGVKCRYTDSEVILLHQEVCREQSSKLVELLKTNGMDAVGFSESPIIFAKRKEAIKVIENEKKKILRGDQSGKIERIDSEGLKSVLSKGKIPVIPPLAIGHNGEPLNVNGDRVCAYLARELGVDTIINLSNIPGFLRNEKVVPEIKLNELEQLRKETRGGMSIKLIGVQEAMNFGVQKFVISSGEIDKPVSSALAGKGTVFLHG